MGYKKMVQSGNLIETYEYQYDVIPRKPRSRTRTAKRRRSPDNLRRPDNILRLRNSFERLVRANLGRGEAPLFLTVTMHAITPIGEAYRIFTGYVQRLRTRFGKSFRYVAVPEFQKRGAVHFHCLVWGWPDQVFLHEGSLGKIENGTRARISRWLNTKGYGISELRNDRELQHLWGYGFIDCIPTDGHTKIAGYLAKYMSKAMLDKRLRNKKAYVASRNALRPVSLSYASAFTFIEEIIGDTQPEVVSKFTSEWLGNATYKRYVFDSLNGGDS